MHNPFFTESMDQGFHFGIIENSFFSISMYIFVNCSHISWKTRLFVIMLFLNKGLIGLEHSQASELYKSTLLAER